MSGAKQELKAALASRDPSRVAKALELPPISPQRRGSPIAHKETLQDASGQDWSNILSSYLDACDAATKGDAVKCFEAQSSLHSALNHIFSSYSGNWLVPALHTVCRNTRLAALAADSGQKDQAKLQSAVTLLQESFSKTLNDRIEYQPNAPLSEGGSKKVGVLFIVNELFSMYFRLNTLRLCKNLVRPVESRQLHLKGRNMGDMVTYRYYVGRLNMFEDQYEAAEKNLEYALVHCHKDAIANKKRILRYLLPVKLYRGHLPTTALLEKYQLNEFVPLVEGIQKGDLRMFNDALVEYQDQFIRRGTYLLLEKCKMVCYRNLFKRVYKIMGTHLIPLDQVARTFKWLGMPIDLDEVECILANLIFRSYVRGYISHAKRVLVLSKSNPFPTAAVIK